MDKLKPILNHSYWIVFVAALIVSTVGWWMASSEIDAATVKAESDAEAAFKGVPPSDSPNSQFGEKVQSVVRTLETENKQHNRYLWEAQLVKHEWPDSIKDEMEKVAYRDEISRPVRTLYRRSYFPELDDLPNIVDAYPGNPLGKVAFDLRQFQPQVGRNEWHRDPPDSETMWNVQEDLWLVRALLSAVAETNSGYDNLLQAPIKEIEQILLRGGNADASSAGAGANASPMDPAGAPAANPGANPGAGLPGAGLPGGGLSGGLPGIPGLGRQTTGMQQSNNAGRLNLDEIFGSDALAGAADAGNPGDPANAGGPANPGAPAAGGPAVGGAFGPEALGSGIGGLNNKNKRRYIDDAEGAPFKTRGFYMQLVMEHTKLSDLMVQLANLDWPVEILRVQLEMANPDQFALASGGRAGRPGMGAGLPGMGPGLPGMGAGLPGRGLGGRGRRNIRIPGLGAMGDPMGPMGPMGPLGPLGPLGRDKNNEAEAKRIAEGQQMYEVGMQKPTLAIVSIAGKMTIFQPPPEGDAATVAAATPGAVAGTAASATPAGAAANPAATGGATPDAGTPPAAGETATPGEPAKTGEPVPGDSTTDPAAGGATPASPAKPPAAESQPAKPTPAVPAQP